MTPDEADQLHRAWHDQIAPFLPDGIDVSDGSAFDLIATHFDDLIWIATGQEATP